jgi:hypothetical protein
MVLPPLVELRRRLVHPFETYKPDNHADRPQLAFHQSPAMVRVAAGGNQSGKSRAVAQELAWWLSERHPYQDTPRAPRIYLISSSYRTIQEGVWRHLKECLPTWDIEAQGPQIPGGWQIPTWVRMRQGGQIDFVSGEGREDARRKVQAAALHLIAIDEEVDELLWNECQTRLLAHGGRIVITATLIRSEPWILDLEDRAESGDKDIEFFRMSTYRAADCGHVQMKVIRVLEATFSEEERRVRLMGHSRRSEGLVYKEFGKKHIILEPFPIPRDWTRYCGIDPGWRTCAVIWVAVSPRNQYVVYREMYHHGAQFYDVVKSILRAEGYEQNDSLGAQWRFCPGITEEVAGRYIDPAAFGHHSTGEIKEGILLAKYSVQLGVGTRLAPAPARNDVLPGIEAIRRDLEVGYDGVPRMRVFHTCEAFIKEMRHYRWKRDDGNPNRNEASDAPVKARDHGLDALRYLANMGLVYRLPQEPSNSSLREDLLFLGAGTSMDERMREHWQKIYERQRDGAEAQAAHPSGIGSEY